MAIYEFTWTVEVSSDEAGLEIFKAMAHINNTAKNMLSDVPGDVTLTLKKVLDTT